jgi:alkanesulfonate monooxygenase SsuD/methylene tetrahydromethanopterin reductase-like flavin-dependent oxidoreductase (luciferase family)
MLSSIAAVTRRMKIGSAVYHVLGRTPATLALQAVGLDELSRGRFLLGVGASNPTVARWHGTTMDHPVARLRSTLKLFVAPCAAKSSISTASIFARTRSN